MQGNQAGAIIWIKRAIDAKWHDIAMIENIPWFHLLKSNPNYLRTVANLKSRIQKMSRDAGNLK